jgi:hypothetical protein
MHKAVASALVAVLVLSAVAAPAYADDPPAIERWLARARSEKHVGLGLVAASVVLMGLGAGLTYNQHDSTQFAGIAMLGLGGGLVIPAISVTVYGAAHQSGLRLLPSQLDDAAASARRQEITGMVLLFSGLAVEAAGLVMVFRGMNLSGFGESAGQSRSGGELLAAGIVLSMIADSAIIAGPVLWAHGSGLKHAVRDARQAALRLGPTGVAGTF